MLCLTSWIHVYYTSLVFHAFTRDVSVVVSQFCRVDHYLCCDFQVFHELSFDVFASYDVLFGDLFFFNIIVPTFLCFSMFQQL